MSESINGAEETPMDHELVNCIDPLKSVLVEKNDGIELSNHENCASSTIDIGSEPNEKLLRIETSILTDTNNDENTEEQIKELETKNEEKLTSEYSTNLNSQTTLDQMDKDVNNREQLFTANSMKVEPTMSLSNIQKKFEETNCTIDIPIDTILIKNESEQLIEDHTDLSTVDLLKPSSNNDSSEFNDEETVLEEPSIIKDKIMSVNYFVNEEQSNQNNVVLNTELYPEHQSSSRPTETLLKTNSRPQRQAAKKAESQIREIAKEITKSIDNIDEKVVDSVQALSSPLKKVCCQCNRFRLCKYTVEGNKAMYLCQEECVANYRWKSGQWDIEKKCEQCLSVIRKNADKSYCWQIKHFCSLDCLSNYQRTILGSNCTNCQKLIKSDANLGKYCRYICGKIVQFCGTVCTESYENRLILCNFCQKELIDNDYEEFCSSFCQTKDYKSRKKHFDPVNSVVDGTNKTTQSIDKCNTCYSKLNSSFKNEIQIFSNTSILLKFCSNECLNKHIVSKKRSVSCSVCKIKKFNFDMISTKNGSTNSQTYICSLSCIHRQHDVPQTKSKKAVCNNCGLPSQARYKTNYNTTTYNFCSQNCSNVFQSTKKQKSKSKKEKQSSRTYTRRTIHKEDNNLSDSDEKHNSHQQKTTKKKKKSNRKISHKDINVSSKTDKEVQTDQTGSKSVIIPVPVPVYIPMPMHMFVMPYPVPVPFPIPLPIPIFIPTTKNTAKSILKDIKKIKDETPADPFEAELLLMAGMVADDKKNQNNSSSDSENDDVPNNDYNDDSKIVSSSARNHNSFGDDVLAIALNMAGADAESLEGSDDIPTITSNDQANQIIDDVEANLVSSTIMPQTPDPTDNITQENMISSPQDMLRRPPRKRAPRSQSQRSTNFKRSRKNDYSQGPCIPSSAGLIQQSQQVMQNSLYSLSMSTIKPDANMCLKYTLGVIAWRQWASIKSIEFEKTLTSNVCVLKKTNIFKLDLLQLTAIELNYCLDLFVKEVRKPNGTEYAPDTIYYLCLGVQQYLYENGRIDNIFTDVSFDTFTDTLNEIAIKFTKLYNDSKFVVTRVEEEYLWESKQLGAHSPYVLLCTLIFFNTKHFNLTTVEEHMQLSFSHIMKHWKRNPNQPSTSGAKAPGTYRNVLLRFYPPQASLDSPNSRKKKVYEQHENEENPLRCPVKLYEFYLSKCPESVKTRNDLFYLTPERSCVPDSPVWYSTGPLNKESLEKMLNRVKMVKEINMALLSS